MSEDSKKFRAAMRAKAQRLGAGSPVGKVDASDFGPVEQDSINADVKTGERPISKRAYKRGGFVTGGAAAHHAGRAARKGGGAAGMSGIFGKAMYNSDVKDANKARDGYVEREGGMKKGGKIKKDGGGPLGGYAMASSPQEQDNPAGVGTKVLPSVSTGKPMFGQAKKGGKIEHPHKAEDKACAQKLARHHKASGGREDPDEAEDKADQAEQNEKKCGGRAKKLGGGPIDPGALQAAAGRMGHKIPPQILGAIAKSGAGGMGAKKGGKVKRADGGETSKDKGDYSGQRESGDWHGKRGGATKRAKGGEVYAPNVKAGPRDEALASGGRTARAHGGKTGKSKMNVNIIIGAHGMHPGGDQPQQPPGAPPMGPPQARPVAVPPPTPMGMPPGGPAGGGAPPPMPMPPPGPMGRAMGGRAYPIDTASGGGKARLAKIKAYGLKPQGDHG